MSGTELNDEEKIKTMVARGRAFEADPETKEKELKKLQNKLKMAKFNLNQVENNIKRAQENVDIFSNQVQEWQMKKIEYNTLKAEGEAEVKGIEKEMTAYR